MIVTCPECGAELAVATLREPRLEHHADGSHTAHIDPRPVPDMVRRLLNTALIGLGLIIIWTIWELAT